VSKFDRDKLNKREVKVWESLHKPNAEIANELGVSLRTIEGHVSAILTKTQSNNRTEAFFKLHSLDLEDSILRRMCSALVEATVELAASTGSASQECWLLYFTSKYKLPKIEVANGKQ
jgi:DNA-binding CsgD family transcriptional regulator